MTVRVYRSTDYGAPILTGQTGKLADLLEACLVTGYGSLSITSITQTGGVATATTDSPHLWGNAPKVLISGANETGYNVEATATITGPSTFTFPVAGGTASPATGTLLVKRNGSGWTTFTGTTIKVLRQPTSGANGFYLRIEDSSTANIARFTGYETMTDANNGTNPFPSVAQLTGGWHVYKSVTLDTVQRPWVLICNGPMFYLVINQASAVDWATAGIFAFGDIVSYKSGDIYHTLNIAGAGTSSSATVFHTQPSNSFLTTPLSGHCMARTHGTTGTSILISKHTDVGKFSGTNLGGTGGMAYPHPTDGGLYAAPIWVSESAVGVVRGVLPGVWSPLHNRPLTHGDVWVATGDLSGKTFEACNSHSGSQVFFETSDTW